MNIWRTPFSHVGIAYTSYVRGFPERNIVYMDDFEGIVHIPWAQFLEDPCLIQVATRPLRKRIMEAVCDNLLRQSSAPLDPQRELRILFGITTPEATSARGGPTSNLEFVHLICTQSGIHLDTSAEHTMEEIPSDRTEPFHPSEPGALVRTVDQLFSLLGLFRATTPDSQSSPSIDIYLSSPHPHFEPLHLHTLPDIDPTIRLLSVETRLRKDRRLSVEFISKMFSMGLLEPSLYEHVADEIDTTVKARALARETTRELFTELLADFCKFLEGLKGSTDTTNERISSLFAQLGALGAALGAQPPFPICVKNYLLPQ